MTPKFSLAVTTVASIAVLALAGCSNSDATPKASPSTHEAFEVAPANSESPPQPTSQAEPGPASGDGDQLSAPGMPELPLFGCAELVESTQNETDFDTQWRWEYECRTAEPFLKTVDSMNNNPGFTHTVDAPSGNPDYLNDRHHYIADYDGVAWDVDLSASGSPDELEVTYVVTLAKP